MATVFKQKEQRVVLHEVRWATYEHLLADHLDCSSPRFTYDEGTLEIMSPSTEHEETNRAIEMLVELIAAEWEVDLRNLGSTTFKREDLKRGFEPDTCFYLDHAEQIRGKDEIDLYNDPPPDLVIEIDVTSESLYKLPIYAALGIPEVWRYSDKHLSIQVLADNDYIEVTESLALPGLTGVTINNFITDLAKLKRPVWMKQIREWARNNHPA